MEWLDRRHKSKSKCVGGAIAAREDGHSAVATTRARVGLPKVDARYRTRPACGAAPAARTPTALFYSGQNHPSRDCHGVENMAYTRPRVEPSREGARQVAIASVGYGPSELGEPDPPLATQWNGGCVNVWVNVWVYVYAYARARALMYTRTCTHTHARTCTHIRCTLTNTNTSTHMMKTTHTGPDDQASPGSVPSQNLAPLDGHGRGPGAARLVPWVEELGTVRVADEAGGRATAVRAKF